MMLKLFLLSASSNGKPKTNLNKSFKNVYCPLLIIHPTLLATSTALAFFPMAGSDFALRNVGSPSTSSLYAASKVACEGREPKDPVGRPFTNFCNAGGSDLLGVVVVGVEREKPTFIAAFKMRILSRVRLASSGLVAVVIVLEDF